MRVKQECTEIQTNCHEMLMQKDKELLQKDKELIQAMSQYQKTIFGLYKRVKVPEGVQDHDGKEETS